MAARMGPLVLPRTPYAVSSARNNFKIDRYLNLSTSQISDRYWDVVDLVHTLEKVPHAYQIPNTIRNTFVLVLELRPPPGRGKATLRSPKQTFDTRD